MLSMLQRTMSFTPCAARLDDSAWDVTGSGPKVDPSPSNLRFVAEEGDLKKSLLEDTSEQNDESQAKSGTWSTNRKWVLVFLATHVFLLSLVFIQVRAPVA
jgi:hypothetical protein